MFASERADYTATIGVRNLVGGQDEPSSTAFGGVDHRRRGLAGAGRSRRTW